MRGRCPAGVIALALVVVACGGGDEDESEAGKVGATTTRAVAASTAPATSDAASDGATTTDAAPASTAPAPSTPPAFDLDAEPNPATIEITLDPGAAASGVVGRAGGTLSATGTDGTVYTLDLPRGALFSDVEITMTPVAQAEGDAIGDTYVAGVDLQPEGLHFLGVAMLTIDAPAGDDAVAWGSDGGEDFHPTPSERDGDTTTIPVVHFSEFGLAERQLLDLIESQGIIAEDLDAQLQALLTDAPDELAIELATNIARLLGDEIDPEDWIAPAADPDADPDEQVELDDPEEIYELFESWSSDVFTHLMRVSWVVEHRGWGPGDPGFGALAAAYDDLLETWFASADLIVVGQEAQCDDGHVEGAFRTLRQAMIGLYGLALVDDVSGPETTDDFRNEVYESYLQPWAEAGVACLLFGVTWQARIVTTGDGFRSDISIGAETSLELGDDFDALQWLIERGGQDGAQDSLFELPSEPLETDLEVEWVEGFFAEPALSCDPEGGRAEMEYFGFEGYLPNLGDFGDVVLGATPFHVRVRVIEPITLVCNPAYAIGGDAAYPFHLGALEHLNGEFDIDGYWNFGMVYEPGGGEVARFEQGFPVDGEGVIIDAPELEFPTGKYELWQLVTVFQN